MQYEWDESKRLSNLKKHGIDFRDALSFAWDTAVEVIDDRADYGETRMTVYGFLLGRLVAMTFTRRDMTVRIISLRQTTRTEEKAYNDYC